MKKIILTLSLFALFDAGLHAGAIITYQGRLKESGSPVSVNKSFGFEFCATPGGTGCVASVDGSQSFQVANGLFKSTFTAPAVDFTAGPWYLRVSVNGTPLLPLEQLTFVPYAVQAASSAYASALAVTSGAGVVASTHIIVMGGISVGDWAVIPSSEAVFQAMGLGQDHNPGAEDIKVAVMGYARSGSADALDLVAGGNFEAEIPSGMNGAMVGLRSVNRNYGSAGMAVGLVIDSLQNTGTIAETYGLMIGTMTGGTQVSRPYAIYSHDPNARTYFAGQVGISSRTPSYSLAVSSASGDLFWVAQDGAHSTKYWGDGSGLTGVTGASGTDNTKVLKTGDTMSGQLTLAGSTLTVVDASGASPGVLWVSTSFSQPILYVSSSGFTGVNTAAPLYPLHLASRQGQTALQIDGYDDSWDTVAIESKTSGQPNISYIRGGLLKANTFVDGSDNFKLRVNGAETLIATPQGKVGVGNTTPLYALHVSSGAGETGIVFAVSTGASHVFWAAGDGAHATAFYGDGSGLSGVTGATGTDSTKVLKAGDTMTGQLTLAASTLTVAGNAFSVGGATFAVRDGMVGIGTATPAYSLHLSSSGAGGYPYVMVENPGTGTPEVRVQANSHVGRIATSGSNGGTYISSLNDFLVFEAASSERMRIAANGNVGISNMQPNPAYNLHISSGQGMTGVIMAVSTGATNVFSVDGYGVSALKFTGNGSGLTGVTATDPAKLPLAGGTMAGDIAMGANNIYAVSTITASGSVTAAHYQISGSTVLALLPGIDSLGVGKLAGRVNAGDSNVFMGYAAGFYNTTAAQNTLIGYEAGYSNTTGGNNSFLGYKAGASNTTGRDNSLVGYQAAYFNQAGSANAVLGNDAGGFGSAAVNSFSSSTLMGYQAGYGLTTGSDNILLGYKAGYAVTTGTGNIVIGYGQGTQNAGANNQLNIGGLLFGDLAVRTIGISTRVPQAALDIVSTGTAVNIYAQIWRSGAGVAVASITSQGRLYADGSGLTGVPGDGLGSHVATTTLNMSAFHIVNVDSMSAAGNITAARYQINGSTVLALSGTDSLGVGVQAGRVNSGDGNTFVGFQAGKVNTSGFQNSFIGNLAGTLNTTGYDNSFMGYQAGNANTTGTQNSFSGYQAGLSNTTGWFNSFYGVFAGLFTKTGSANAIFGAHAGYGATGQSFSSSTLMGYQAGYGLTTGSDNILLGYQAGYAVTTGTGNIVIGYGQGTQNSGANNQLNIGGLLFGDLAARTIGISTRAPQAALDIVAPGTYAQIWRNSAGVQVASLTATGIYYGNGSGLTGVSALDVTKLPLSGGVVTGEIDFNSNLNADGAATFVSSITALGSNQFGDAVADTHGVNMAPAAGTALSVNGTGTAGDDAAKFYSNGSLIMGIRKK